MTALFAALVGGMEVGQAAEKVQFFQKGQAAAAQIFAIINRQPVIQDVQPNPGADPLSKADSAVGFGAMPVSAQCEGTVELRNVRFAYPARPESIVLKSFSLQVPAGKTVALVGESGSGKSTIVGLLERFYDPQQGQVCFMHVLA